MSIRPWFCLEKRCCPLLTFHDHTDLTNPEPGKSVFCWGKVDQPIQFIYDGVEHKNDLNWCIYTPLKGVVKIQTNKEDWELLKIGSERSLEKLKDIENGTKE